MKQFILILVASIGILLSSCTPPAKSSIAPSPVPSITPTPVVTKKIHRLGTGGPPVIIQFTCNQGNTSNPQLYTCVFVTPTPVPT